jgi:hypothetical protein
MLLDGLAEVVDGFAEPGTFTVTRQASRAYFKGRLENAPEPTTVQISAHVQPTVDSEAREAEGDYPVKGIRIFTTSELRISGGANEADRIEYPAGSGLIYEVDKIEDWAAVAGFWVATAILLQTE